MEPCEKCNGKLMASIGDGVSCINCGWSPKFFEVDVSILLAEANDRMLQRAMNMKPLHRRIPASHFKDGPRVE